MITDDAFGHANPLLDETRARAQKVLVPRLKSGIVPVVTGYVASTADGVTTTLGRGGSDYSAAVLAAATKADDLRIYTDVSGVMSADPRVVKGAKPLESMSYAEAAELTYFGAKVIHPRTVLPAVEAGIPVRILNTFAPNDEGTTITADPVFDGSVVKATTSLGGLGLVTVQGAGMSGVPGFAARVFDTTAAEKVSVLMISQSSSENSICLVVPAESTQRLRTALERMFSAELRRHDVEQVEVETPWRSSPRWGRACAGRLAWPLARLRRARPREGERHGDRAGLERAEHLARGQRGRPRQGCARDPRRVPREVGRSRQSGTARGNCVYRSYESSLLVAPTCLRRAPNDDHLADRDPNRRHGRPGRGGRAPGGAAPASHLVRHTALAVDLPIDGVYRIQAGEPTLGAKIAWWRYQPGA